MFLEGRSWAVYEALEILTFYTQMYSTSAVVLFSILTWTLALSYRIISNDVHVVQTKLHVAFQKDFIRQLNDWDRLVNLIDDCGLLVNQTFFLVLFILLSSLFLRMFSTLVALIDSISYGIYNGLLYDIPTIIKYAFHLWLISYTAETNIEEVCNSIILLFDY